MLTYADVCRRMLTYADVCYADVCYADVCCRTLTEEGWEQDEAPGSEGAAFSGARSSVRMGGGGGGGSSSGGEASGGGHNTAPLLWELLGGERC
jgi:uncharacterized membrane protein YgcG